MLKYGPKMETTTSMVKLTSQCEQDTYSYLQGGSDE